MVDKVASGQVFSEYFGFPCQNCSFHQIHHHQDHQGQLAEALRRADHSEAAKAQNWALEPHGKKLQLKLQEI
jgi:hypothetical protein